MYAVLVVLICYECLVSLQNTGRKTADVGAFVWADTAVEQIFWIHWSTHCQGGLLEEDPPHQSAIPDEVSTIVMSSTTDGMSTLDVVSCDIEGMSTLACCIASLSFISKNVTVICSFIALSGFFVFVCFHLSCYFSVGG